MLDHYSVPVHNNQQVAALPQLDRGSDYESERHRFESYTPHHLRLKLPATGAFLLRKHRIDSNLGRGAGVKKTRSVFSPRASTPAGGRSRVLKDLETGRGRLAAMHLKETVPGKFREIPFGTGHVDFESSIRKAWELGVRRYVTEFWYTGSPAWKEDIDFAVKMMTEILDRQTV